MLFTVVMEVGLKEVEIRLDVVGSVSSLPDAVFCVI